MFKNILYEIVNKYHNEFLDKNSNLIKFDPFKEMTWYSGFNLEGIEDIPFFNLINDNKFEESKSIGDFIKSNDIKNILITEAIEKLAKEKLNKNQDFLNLKHTSNSTQNHNNRNPFGEDRVSNINNEILSKYISNDIIEKVIII